MRPFSTLQRLLLIINLLISRQGTTTATKSVLRRLGPIGLFQNGYTWQASVDRTTGEAFAKEVSQMPRGWNAKQQSSGAQLLSQTKVVLGTYPEWLCRGSVTFGLLKAVPVASGTEIRTRLLGINILTLGTPTRQRLSFKKEKGADVDGGNREENSVQWSYPILGGLMTATQPAGQLVMTLHSIASPSPTLDTQLVAYRPALVGKHAPSNPIRTSLYLGTQSVIHGYAMWRYHRYVRSSLFPRKPATDRHADYKEL